MMKKQIYIQPVAELIGYTNEELMLPATLTGDDNAGPITPGGGNANEGLFDEGENEEATVWGTVQF